MLYHFIYKLDPPSKRWDPWGHWPWHNLLCTLRPVSLRGRVVGVRMYIPWWNRCLVEEQHRHVLISCGPFWKVGCGTSDSPFLCPRGPLTGAHWARRRPHGSPQHHTLALVCHPPRIPMRPPCQHLNTSLQRPKVALIHSFPGSGKTPPWLSVCEKKKTKKTKKKLGLSWSWERGFPLQERAISTLPTWLKAAKDEEPGDLGTFDTRGSPSFEGGDFRPGTH